MAKQSVHADGQTRKEIRKRAKAEKQTETPKWIRIRLLPIWLRIILVILLTAGSLVVGVMVGYGVLGDGKPQDALEKATWTHIIDLVVEKK